MQSPRPRSQSQEPRASGSRSSGRASRQILDQTPSREHNAPLAGPEPTSGLGQDYSQIFNAHVKMVSVVDKWNRGGSTPVSSFLRQLTQLFHTCQTPDPIRPGIAATRLRDEALRAYQEEFLARDDDNNGVQLPPSWSSFCTWITSWGTPNAAAAVALQTKLTRWSQKTSETPSQWAENFFNHTLELPSFPTLQQELPTAFLISRIIDGIRKADPVYERVYNRHQDQPFKTLIAARDYIQLQDRLTMHQISRKQPSKTTTGPEHPQARGRGTFNPPQNASAAMGHHQQAQQLLTLLSGYDSAVLAAAGITPSLPAKPPTGPLPSQKELEIMGTTVARTGRRPPSMKDNPQARSLCQQYQACTRCREPYSACRAATCTKFPDRTEFKTPLNHLGDTAADEDQAQSLNQ